MTRSGKRHGCDRTIWQVACPVAGSLTGRRPLDAPTLPCEKVPATGHNQLNELLRFGQQISDERNAQRLDKGVTYLAGDVELLEERLEHLRFDTRHWPPLSVERRRWWLRRVDQPIAGSYSRAQAVPGQVRHPMLTERGPVAGILNVPVSTVHYWASARKGPPSFKVEKHRRWAVSDVVAYIEAQREAARE